MPKLSELIDGELKVVIADTQEARRLAYQLATTIRQEACSMGLTVVEVGIKRPSRQGMWKITFPFPTTRGSEVLRVAVGCRAFERWVKAAREHALWLAWVLVVVPEPLTPESEQASYWLQPVHRRRGRVQRRW